MNILISDKIVNGKFVYLLEEVIEKRYGVNYRAYTYFKCLFGDKNLGLQKILKGVNKKEVAKLSQSLSNETIDNVLEASRGKKEGYYRAIENNIEAMYENYKSINVLNKALEKQGGWEFGKSETPNEKYIELTGLEHQYRYIGDLYETKN